MAGMTVNEVDEADEAIHSMYGIGKGSSEVDLVSS
jgi:hypothetical protein